MFPKEKKPGLPGEAIPFTGFEWLQVTLGTPSSAQASKEKRKPKDRWKAKHDELEKAGLLCGPALVPICLEHCEIRKGDLWIALYKPGTDLSSATAYTSEGEVKGEGYEAGGKEINNRLITLGGQVVGAILDNVCWTDSSIEAEGYIVYDKGNKNAEVSIGTFSEGVAKSENGPFWISFQKHKKMVVAWEEVDPEKDTKH